MRKSVRFQENRSGWNCLKWMFFGAESYTRKSRLDRTFAKETLR